MIQTSLTNASSYLNAISPEEGSQRVMYHKLQENLTVLMERYANLMAAFGLESGDPSKRKTNRLSRRKGAVNKAPA